MQNITTLSFSQVTSRRDKYLAALLRVSLKVHYPLPSPPIRVLDYSFRFSRAYSSSHPCTNNNITLCSCARSERETITATGLYTRISYARVIIIWFPTRRRENNVKNDRRAEQVFGKRSCCANVY